jgi:hypothetical protein
MARHGVHLRNLNQPLTAQAIHALRVAVLPRVYDQTLLAEAFVGTKRAPRRSTARRLKVIETQDQQIAD